VDGENIFYSKVDFVTSGNSKSPSSALDLQFAPSVSCAAICDWTISYFPTKETPRLPFLRLGVIPVLLKNLASAESASDLQSADSSDLQKQQ